MNTKPLFIAALAATLLAACGDNPQDAPEMPPPAGGNPVPASATTSPRAYAQFAASLSPSESGTPLDVSAVTPPTSETEQPETL